MSAATAKGTRQISIEEFIGQLGFDRGQDKILAACYYAEILLKQPDFGPAEIQALLDEAKLPRVGNLPRDLKSLLSKKCLNTVKGYGTRYTLTSIGINFIGERMQEVGLTISKPTERAELIKEITESLHELVQQIPDRNEREYIEEALSCLSPVNNASRAAVVMAWAGTVYNLRRKIDSQGPLGYSTFTLHLKKINPKKSASTFNDLEDVKDTDLLDICEKMDIIKGKMVKTQLGHCLDLRNGVGHPSNVRPGPYKVRAFFEDIVKYVLAVP